MTFRDILTEAMNWLQQDQRLSYRALQRQFDLDDDYLEDLKIELIEIKQVAVDQDHKMLVWTGVPTEALPPPLTSPPSQPQQSSPMSYTPQYLTEKILTSRSALEGERKQVTVLFADIKDSTELIRELDPEDAQQLLDPAIHIMMEAVHRFEGTVNQVLGDGVMSIFGAPIAHEDHAARGCYAALAMQAAMRDYTEKMRRTHGIPLQIRVGLNAGEVVVRTITSDLHMDYSAVGATTHLAARMEQLATPGSIVLSGSTLRLVEGLVEVTALGPVPVKGMTDPVETYELMGASSIQGRLQAAVVRGLTKFVGRDAEVDVLHQALEQARSGHGQVVAVVAEPGVGKSRTFYEFVHSHWTQGWRVLESASVSYGKATPYFPIIDMLKRYLHLEEEDDPHTIRAKVTGQILTLDKSLQETIPTLLSLLDALPEDSAYLQLDPLQRRQQILDGLKRLLLKESQVQPLLWAFEDLHWIDSETQAFLDSLVESLPTAPFLLLVNYRPEYQHHWGSKTYYTQLRLDPLRPENAEGLLHALLGDEASLEPLKRLLIDQAQGNPFFLEESVRTLVETATLVGESGAYRLTQDLPILQVPATVQVMLAARIDRLPQDEKRLLQMAAVIGTEVPFSLLHSIAEQSEDALYGALTHLQAGEFLYETTLFPERVYTFKHALTHEVAYSSLLQERRRRLHAQIVEVLEAFGHDRLDEQVERLAHHALRGEVWKKALFYYQQAGKKAVAHSANREAVSCYEQALIALQHLPENHTTMTQGIDLHFDLRNALVPLREHGQTLATLREAERLANAVGDDRRLGQVFCYLTSYFFLHGEFDQAITAGHRALALADALDDVELQVATNFFLSQAYNAQGDYGQAIECCQQNLALLHGELLYERCGLIGLASVWSRTPLVNGLRERGEFTEGAIVSEEALGIAEVAQHPLSLVTALDKVGSLHCRQGNFRKAIPALERGVALCQRGHFPLVFSGIASQLGFAYAMCGRLTEALSILEQLEVGLGDSRDANYIRRLSEIYRLDGRLEDASHLANQALDLTRTGKQRGMQAWALRALGDIGMDREPPDTDAAGSNYRQAFILATELGMHPLQAHCHRGLGMVYRQIGQSEQARAELSTAIEMYRDMDMTFWLPETEAALTNIEG